MNLSVLMCQSDRVKLHFGTYKRPLFKVGQEVRCSIYGKMVIAGVSKSLITWPQCRPHIRHALIIYNDLEKAIRRESTSAVAHWWRVSTATVMKWRHFLGVPNLRFTSLRLLGFSRSRPRWLHAGFP